MEYLEFKDYLYFVVDLDYYELTPQQIEDEFSDYIAHCILNNLDGEF